jgi:hypothetical protein
MVRALFLARRGRPSLRGAAIGALLMSSLIAAGCRRQGPARYFRAIRTEGQADCGSLVQRHPYRETLLANPKVSECVAAARREHRPFFAYIEGQGTDSYFATGFVGDSQGQVTLFSYDSDPCGWNGLAPWPFCSEEVHIHRCTPVDALMDSGRPGNGCAQVSEMTAVH